MDVLEYGMVISNTNSQRQRSIQGTPKKKKTKEKTIEPKHKVEYGLIMIYGKENLTSHILETSNRSITRECKSSNDNDENMQQNVTCKIIG